jgi:prepilin-type N-terminal cleavage/methylation domain-containing protein
MRLRKGFTLIELLIVVVILGILATIAMGKFQEVRRKAFVAAMESDLRNLSIHQEVYHAQSNSGYANSLALTEFVESKGVKVTITAATATGWAATAVHDGLPGAQCGIFIGSASASDASPATQEGEIACTH